MYPHERSLVKAMENKPFALLGVNSDGSKEELKQVIEKEKMTWRSWFDGSTQGPIAGQWGVNGWPTLYVIDHKGVIRHKWVGSPGGETLDQAIEKLVQEAEEDAKKS
jgi:peroxiredoxin